MTWQNVRGVMRWVGDPIPDEAPTLTLVEEFHDIDPVVVERILGGEWRLRCNRPERDEVIRRWLEQGHSQNYLARMTGWNVPRDLRRVRGPLDALLDERFGPSLWWKKPLPEPMYAPMRKVAS